MFHYSANPSGRELSSFCLSARLCKIANSTVYLCHNTTNKNLLSWSLPSKPTNGERWVKDEPIFLEGEPPQLRSKSALPQSKPHLLHSEPPILQSVSSVSLHYSGETPVSAFATPRWLQCEPFQYETFFDSRVSLYGSMVTFNSPRTKIHYYGVKYVIDETYSYDTIKPLGCQREPLRIRVSIHYTLREL